MRANLTNRAEHGRDIFLTFRVGLSDTVSIPDGELDLTIKKWKSPRSREALNYSWQLITDMAEKLSIENPISKDELYKRLVDDYGILERDENNQLVKIVIKAEIDPLELDVYLHQTPHTTRIDDTIYRLYYLVKPPHEYNTQEFAQFLDQIIAEAKEIGINV